MVATCFAKHKETPERPVYNGCGSIKWKQKIKKPKDARNKKEQEGKLVRVFFCWSCWRSPFVGMNAAATVAAMWRNTEWKQNWKKHNNKRWRSSVSGEAIISRFSSAIIGVKEEHSITCLAVSGQRLAALWGEPERRTNIPVATLIACNGGLLGPLGWFTSATLVQRQSPTTLHTSFHLSHHHHRHPSSGSRWKQVLFSVSSIFMVREYFYSR